MRTEDCMPWMNDQLLLAKANEWMDGAANKLSEWSAKVLVRVKEQEDLDIADDQKRKHYWSLDEEDLDE